MFEYTEVQNGNVLIKSWLYPDTQEMDLEIWVNGEYAQTITVDLLQKEDEVA